MLRNLPQNVPKTFRGTVPCANVLWRSLIIWCWRPLSSFIFFHSSAVMKKTLQIWLLFFLLLDSSSLIGIPVAEHCVCNFSIIFFLYLPPVSLSWRDGLKSREATQEARTAKAWINIRWPLICPVISNEFYSSILTGFFTLLGTVLWCLFLFFDRKLKVVLNWEILNFLLI